MSSVKAPLSTRLKASLKASLYVFTRPASILVTILGTFLVSGFILWSLNLGLLRYVWLEAPISFTGKMDFFLSVYKDIFTNYTSIQGTGIVIFSVLFGLNLALLVYAIRNNGFSSIPKKSGIGGFTLAILGGGCVACGTSLIAPLAASLGATSLSSLREVGTIFNFLGSLLIIYSIYKLGLVISYIKVKNE